MKRKTTHQSELELVSIETLVPQDHLLRKINQAIDFSFIYDKVEHLYCADNGRPPIDPVLLFKMLHTDSTHLEANANKNKHEKKLVEKSTRSYLAELDADISAKRDAHGKKPLKPKEDEPEPREIKSSTTDPDSGIY